MFPGSSVRLKSAYTVTCTGFEEDSNGNVTEVRCKYYPESSGGKNITGVKVKSTIHWLNVNHCSDVQVNLYDSLFNCSNPENEGSILSKINDNSLKIIKNCKIEQYISDFKPGDHFQFLRNGYFCVDSEKNENGLTIFNKSVSLKSSFK